VVALVWRPHGLAPVLQRLRPRSGSGQRVRGRRPSVRNGMHEWETPEVQGDGEQSRDFTYIDDVIEANLLAGLAPEQARGRAMNVGGGHEPTSVNRILEIVAGLIGVKPEPVHNHHGKAMYVRPRPTSRSRGGRSATSPRSTSRRASAVPWSGSDPWRPEELRPPPRGELSDRGRRGPAGRPARPVRDVRPRRP
jgi:nucleoside-diphosphate-sugar epimerase